ncbi:MAG: EF-hand domain-containing protein [Verrucomicrobiota bacterium]
MKLAPVLTGVIALSLAMCANTHKAPKRSVTELEATFQRKDTNHNGYLSKDEFLVTSKDIGKSTRTFLKKDRNGDGKLSEQEFVTHIAKNL